MTLTPAYGRDYTSAKALLKDFHNEKDFLIHTPQGSTYINKQQVAASQQGERNITIQFRYNKLRSIYVLRLQQVVAAQQGESK